MEGVVKAKLTRTQSSLLRSSPTIRSSIHSMTSLAEEDTPTLLDPPPKHKPNRSGSTPRRTGSVKFTPVLTIVSLTFLTILTFSLFFFFYYSRRDEIPTSENLLLALIFVAVTLFFASKNKTLINQNVTVLRRLCLCNKTGRNKSKPVQWFIGESNQNEWHKKSNSSVKGKGEATERVEFYENGDVYEGEYFKGKSNGNGVYNYFVNGRYEGEWVDGRYDGYGIESWARGSRYRGQYRQGLRHGFGVYRFYTGDSYSGEWCIGQSHGFGVQCCSDGSSYVGQFKCGVKHGLGVYYFRNGDRYAGEYFGDKVHGFGVYHFANGHCYEGSWHEGKKQGYGMYTFRNGDPRCGEWDGGDLRIPLPQHSEPVLRAVQSARRTAENAIHLCRVDEEVNKAVQAANRAATAARVAAVKAVQNRIDGKFCDSDV